MKRILSAIAALCMILFNVHAQKNPMCVYESQRDPYLIDLPANRDIYGGTIIRVTYEGTGITTALKGAFEYACKLVEEKTPTTFPINIRVRVSALSGADCLAKVEKIRSNTDVDKITQKRRLQLYDELPVFNSDEEGLAYFRDSYDATITFTNRKVFSYNIDPTLTDFDKFDFVTVATQALLKAVLFSIYANPSGESLERIDSLSYYTDLMLRGNAQENYVRATSDNLYIYTWENWGIEGSGERWKLVSDAPYRHGISLCYFEDSNDVESLIMQYGVSRGGYIRHIGAAVAGTFAFCGWKRDILTGDYGVSVRNGNTGDVTPFRGISTSAPDDSIANAQLQTPENGGESYYEYMNSRYEVGNQGGRFVLLKDGSWKPFEFYTDLTENDLYARSADGHLRIKYLREEPGPGSPPRYSNWIVEHSLYAYIPQKPEGAYESYSRSVSTQYAQRSDAQIIFNNYDIDNEFADVKIAFKNVEGTTQVMVEQTDSDYPVPFTYYVTMPKAGSFTAFMNRRYTSTFKLTYINENGQTEGDVFTVDLRGDPTRIDDDDLDLEISEGTIEIDCPGLEGDGLGYIISNAISGQPKKRGTVTEDSNIIDISTLQSGVYVISISDGARKIKEQKWYKK